MSLLLWFVLVSANAKLPAEPCFSQPNVSVQGGARTADSSFTEKDASHLLNQISQGLVSRNQGQVLRAFDLGKMQNGTLFRQQIVSFIAHAENIRFYFHLTRVSAAALRGETDAEVEMEADPRDSNNAGPLHKQARLHLAAQSTSAGWKFVDVQPRAFFSMQP